MAKFAFVSTSLSIISSVEEYFQSSVLDRTSTFFVVEFFEQKIPLDLPKNCIATSDLLDQREINRIGDLLCAKGPIIGVIALGELSLYPAADLRQKLGLPGPYKPTIKRFREKIEMKSALSKSGIRIPKIYTLQEIKNNDVIFPLVAKPRAYCGPIGIRVIVSLAELEPLLTLKPKPLPVYYDSQYPELRRDDYQFEEFIAGVTYEIVALVAQGKMIHSRSFKQINTSIDFMAGKPLGIVSVNQSEEIHLWQKFAEKVLCEMKAPDGAFVIQAILTPQRERVFLGATSLPPSASLSRLIKEACGVDYRWIHIQCQSGGWAGELPISDSDQFMGSLIFPMNYLDEGQSPTQFVKSVKRLPEGVLPTLKWASYPAIGDPSENDFAYAHNLGRFMFLSEDSNAIENDIQKVMDIYKVEVSK